MFKSPLINCHHAVTADYDRKISVCLCWHVLTQFPLCWQALTCFGVCLHSHLELTTHWYSCRIIDGVKARERPTAADRRKPKFSSYWASSERTAISNMFDVVSKFFCQPFPRGRQKKWETTIFRGLDLQMPFTGWCASTLLSKGWQWVVVGRWILRQKKTKANEKEKEIEKQKNYCYSVMSCRATPRHSTSRSMQLSVTPCHATRYAKYRVFRQDTVTMTWFVHQLVLICCKSRWKRFGVDGGTGGSCYWPPKVSMFTQNTYYKR